MIAILSARLPSRCRDTLSTRFSRPPVPKLFPCMLSIMTAAAAAAAPPAGHAQQEMLIQQTCGESATIHTQRELRLGGPSDPGRIGMTGNFAVDSRGRFIIFRENQGHVFDTNGRYVRSFGGAGQGPGEYRNVRHLGIGPGDTLHLIDTRNARLTVLAPDFSVLRTQPLAVPALTSAVRRPSGDWIIAAEIRSPDAIGWPLHVIGRGGNIDRSFGALVPAGLSDLPSLNNRVVALADSNRVWSAHERDYRIELWDESNRRLRTLVRRVDWFPAWTASEGTFPDRPWKPRIREIRIDSTGILWVVIMKSKSNWRDYIEEFTPGQFAIREPMHQAFNIVLEAVDVTRACVLARSELSEFLLGHLSDGRFLAYHETAEGIPFLDVLRVRLIRGSAR